MCSKLLRPHSLSITAISQKVIFPHNPFTPKSQFRPLCSIQSLSPTPSANLQLPNPGLSYGPSLHKGSNPCQSQQPQFHSSLEHPVAELEEEHDGNVINEQSFSRVFDIAALRVPSKDCFVLENRLRGHLLNWPRIRNIARVPGDEVEEEFVKLLGDKKSVSDGEDDGENFDSLNRRIYGKAEGDGEALGPVLYREKLVRTFNTQGFVKFRNLAKMSRPSKKRKGEGMESIKRKQGIGKNEFAVVEVVEDEEVAEDLRGLLGDDFKGRKWRGPTRLLLLDALYARKDVEDLPEAIKVVLNEDTKTSTFELVRCKLTLFYSYWQMNEILEAILPKGMIVPSAFESVGHIAHLNLRDEHLPYKYLLAKVILDKNKPKIQTVVNKIDAIDNNYRTMQLEVLVGNHSLVTTVVENGMRFHVDLSTVYWNSRLATERQRLLTGFSRHDVVCDVFSGVGPIAIPAAKIVKRVYANDLNPHAIEYLERNSVLNKVAKNIEVFNMDGRRFIDAVFTSETAQSITQVVMNLPKDAVEYLDVFRGIFRNRPTDRGLTFPMIHVYGFSKASDPEFEFHERIRIALAEVAVDVKMRKVRLVAPGKWMFCASFILPESVAFAKPIRVD